MSVFFSGTEIIEVAIRIEKNGEQFYSFLTSSFKDQRLKQMFEFLAKEERQHITDFEKLSDLEKKEDFFTPYDWEEAGQYFGALAGSRVFTETNEGIKAAQKVKDPLEAIEVALKFEQDSLLFYYGILDATKEQGQKVVRNIINQEKEHVRKLTGVKKELTP